MDTKVKYCKKISMMTIRFNPSHQMSARSGSIILKKFKFPLPLPLKINLGYLPFFKEISKGHLSNNKDKKNSTIKKQSPLQGFYHWPKVYPL